MLPTKYEMSTARTQTEKDVQTKTGCAVFVGSFKATAHTSELTWATLLQSLRDLEGRYTPFHLLSCPHATGAKTQGQQQT